jgi:hypothetical protein
MIENTPEEESASPQAQKLKYFWRAAIIGSVVSVSGAFAFCVYDGYTRLHEGFCGCAKYGAMVAAAFSHPLIIMGALAGISVLAAGYLARLLCRIFFHHRRSDNKDEGARYSH